MSDINRTAGKLTLGTTVAVKNTGEIVNSSGSVSLTSGTDTLAVSSIDGVTFPKTTVTQLTSDVTTVIANESAGVITTFASTLAAGASSTFTVTNSVIATTSVVVAGIAGYTGTGTPVVRVSSVSADAFTLTLTNAHASAALNAVVKISFIAV